MGCLPYALTNHRTQSKCTKVAHLQLQEGWQNSDRIAWLALNWVKHCVPLLLRLPCSTADNSKYRKCSFSPEENMGILGRQTRRMVMGERQFEGFLGRMNSCCPLLAIIEIDEERRRRLGGIVFCCKLLANIFPLGGKQDSKVKKLGLSEINRIGLADNCAKVRLGGHKG